MRPSKPGKVEGTKGKVTGTSKGKLGAFDRPDAGEGILGKGTWTGGFSDGRFLWLGGLDKGLLR